VTILTTAARQPSASPVKAAFQSHSRKIDLSELHIGPLVGAERGLLDRFYRQHRSRMRASAEGQLWVARAPGIVGGLCLSQVPGGWWLTGLFVAPQQRGQQVASQLVNAALASLDNGVWLFCHPELVAFYQRLGFGPSLCLPPVLADRLARYQRTKPLVALERARPLADCSLENGLSG
jgi:GNAT superfamily N-acetyltransferase